MRLKNILVLLMSVAIVVMLLLSLALTYTTTSTYNDIEYILYTHESMDKANYLMANMIDQETGMRGYLATGDKKYLEPYNDAVARFDHELESLKDTVKENPEQVAKLIEIEELANRWHLEAADIYMAIKSDIVSAQEINDELFAHTTSGIGKEKMDYIRKVLEEVEDETLSLNILLSMLNMETGVRAYVINREVEYLEPYYQGFNRVNVLLEELDNPTITLLINDWIDNVALKKINLVQEMQKFKNEGDLELELSKGQGKYLMDQIREKIHVYVSYEEEVLVKRNEKLRGQYQMANTVIITAFVLIILIGAIQLRTAIRISGPLEDFAKDLYAFDSENIGEPIKLEKKSFLEIEELYEGYEKLTGELQRSQKALSDLVRTDQLTQVNNRRGFDEHLEHEWLRAVRNKHVLTLLIIDIDCFKNYNDTHGHVKGDECLKRVAEVIDKDIRRPPDVAARYGGEEFAVLLPETNVAGGYTIAERIRRDVEALGIDNSFADKKNVITVSIGLAGFVPSVERSKEQLIEYADFAMYQAKETGRNRTVIHDLE